jgi:hypothetical protein
MHLTDEEQKMLEGKFGQGVAEAMKIQVAIGEAFSAERMVRISRAHEAFGGSDSCVWFLEMLANLGARCQVPITCNPIWDPDYFKSIGISFSEEDVLPVVRTKAARKKLGIIPNECCISWIQDNVPNVNEVIAFSESSATPYVNSICGARTHRESANSALAAAITGRVPLYGFLLDGNRKGDILVKVEATLQDDFDYHLLGMAVGKVAGTGIPVFDGMSTLRPFPYELISLGAQLATTGAVPMYHIPGITAEAPDLETAFGGKGTQKKVVITDADLRKTQASASYENGKIDFIMFGCPHYSLDQVQDVARLLEGKRIKKGVDLWVLTSPYIKEIARQMGYLEIINKAGGHVMGGTCSDMICWERLYKGKVGITDSYKALYYDLHRGINFILKRRSECIEAALKGGC